MFAAFLSAILNASEIILDKATLRKKVMSGLSLLKVKISLVALFLVVPTIIWGYFSPELFTPKYILLFLAIIVNAIVFNLLYYSSIDKKDVSEAEPIVLLSIPITIVLAMIVFPAERNLSVVIIAGIATAALLLSRFEKKHFDFDKYSWRLIGYDLLCAVETILVKFLLEVTNSVGLYGIRTAVLAIILFLLLHNIKIIKTNKKEATQVVVNSGLTSIEYVARFFAIGAIGIVYSSLIFLLGPIIILIFSRIFFKEKISLKRGIGDAVILICIGVILLLK